MEYSNDLLRHATEHSSSIEGEATTGPSFENHLRAALLARRAGEVNQLLHPRIYHQLLFEGLPINSTMRPGALVIPGEYRPGSVKVYVRLPDGRNHFFPDSATVPSLMNSWNMTAATFHQAGMPMTRAEIRWKFHAWFESIHPFVDGNGRVGRLLWWNMAMIANETIEVIAYDERQVYYDRMGEWREVYSNRTNMNPFS